MTHYFRIALAAVFSILMAPAIPAQESAPGPAPSVSPDAEENASPASPRASLQAFLDACREGRYEEAAKHLSLEGVVPGRGPELARRLKDVLDRYLWVDLSLVSAQETGDLEDGLGASSERIGFIPVAGGRQAPVNLVRQAGVNGDEWVFSAGTVARIDGWYESLGDRWIREHLPAVLLRPGPRELLWWQWLALLPLGLISWAGGRLLGALTRRVLAKLTSRTQSDWDDKLLARLTGPLTLAWSLLLARALLEPLALYPPAEVFLVKALRSAGLAVVFWGLWRVVDIIADAIELMPAVQGRPSARSMLMLGERLGKVLVAAFGVVAALSELGYPVASLVAGLGLGGLAFALAAQKTVENLFGSVALAADEPFRVGDFVHIEDFVGTVEAIGLRSTQIRTLDRTLISIPNGKLADMRLESFAARDRLRLACIVSLVYSTTAEQMRTVLAGLEEVLRSHPKIWPDTVVVRFKELGASSLDIEIMAWFQTQDWGEFQLIRQGVLIQFMEVVEKAGSEFAFPTQTLHIEGKVKSEA